ncbi:Maf family protein [Sphingobacterium yanglingense]|uniref:dTTP/UTP pyrophosphatase n=1 Tax=Sphingobacterium yanglingense TaxID=1437280 RepID=A0A4R6WP05_9SPHI|nr:Maf family protein [Sphingobacterium yanglingense]TDQ82815.1 septum formation protein [Sphingobacterium yanglingense]
MLFLEAIAKIPIILGSQSPRRKELLSSLDLNFEIVVREIDESIPAGVLAEDAAEYIAVEKIKAFAELSFSEHIVITADTVVVDGEGTVLGKPKNIEEARMVLSGLSGKSHCVYTGVAVAYHGEIRSFTCETIVRFRTLDKEEIEYYLNKYKPYDKAGSYGIQEWIGRIGVDAIEGSFENVVGLPTARLYDELKRIVLSL